MAGRLGASLARLMTSLVWAMEASRLSALWERVVAGVTEETSEASMRSHALEVEHVALEAARGDDGRMTSAGTIAVIPMMGEIYARENLFSLFFGGAVIDRMRAQLRKALADDTVKAVIFKVDSPGGTVDGVPEFADELLDARTQKPIVAMVDAGMAASAAYWLASQMTSISVTSSSQVGSIGVLSVHFDESGYLEKLGVKPTIVRSSPSKAAGNPYEPLSDEAKADLQAVVDVTAGQFRAAVARGRGVTAKVVKDSFGEGKMFLASDAKRLGTIDRVETFDALVARLAGTKRSGAKADVMPVDVVADVTDAVDEFTSDGGVAPLSVQTDVEVLDGVETVLTDTQVRDICAQAAEADLLAARVAIAKHGLDR